MLRSLDFRLKNKVLIPRKLNDTFPFSICHTFNTGHNQRRDDHGVGSSSVVLNIPRPPPSIPKCLFLSLCKWQINRKELRVGNSDSFSFIGMKRLRNYKLLCFPFPPVNQRKRERERELIRTERINVCLL